MSELILETQAFLHRTPIEPVKYTGEAAPEPEKNKKWLKRMTVAAVGYLAFVAVDNARFYYDSARVSADDNQMLYDIDGCEPFPYTENPIHTDASINSSLQEAEMATHTIEQDFAGTKSAARKFEPLKFNPINFIGDWIEIHKYKHMDFTSEISGLQVHLYSDTEANPFNIEDEEETINTIDALIHSTLDPRVKYDHMGVSAYVDCLRERFIDPDGPRELEGETLHVYVPSRPGVCFSNGLVQDIPDEAIYGLFCDSIGATKDIRIAVRPFYEYRRNWMVLMTNHKEPASAEQKLSKMFVHEPTHFLMETAGMPFRYDENERLAKYLEQEVLSQLYSEGLPRSLVYPEAVLSLNGS